MVAFVLAPREIVVQERKKYDEEGVREANAIVIVHVRHSIVHWARDAHDNGDNHVQHG